MGAEQITLAIQGLSRGEGGALKVERALARVPGVVRASVNPLTERASIECDRPLLTDLRAAMRRAGYQADIPIGRA